MSGGGMGTVLGGAAGFALGGPGGAMIGAGLGNKMGSHLTGENKVHVPDAMPKGQWNLSGADGKLRGDLLLNGQMPQAATQSQGVLNQLQQRATAQGPSQQAQYLQQANDRNISNNLDKASAMQRSGLADAASGLAMRGGLDAGARERLARGSNMDSMMNKQRTLNDGAGNNLNILAQDEAQKTGMLQALPSQLLAQAGFEQAGKQFDISNTLGTVGGKYNADMQAWGATQAAREQAQLANKNRGMLGLGILGL